MRAAGWLLRAVAMVVTTFVFAAGCGPTTGPPRPPGDGAGCEDLASCEAALAAATPEQVPGLLDTYVAVGGDADLKTLAEPPAQAGQLTVVHDGTPPAGAPAGQVIELTLSGPNALAIVVAVGRAGQRDHVIASLDGSLHHVFPNDRLMPFLLGVAPVLSADPAKLAADVELEAAVRNAIDAAGRLDYVTAAFQGDALDAAIAAAAEPVGGDREMLWRARYARQRLSSVGLILNEEDEDDEDDATEEVQRQRGAGSTPYADLLAVRLHAEPEAAFAERSARILPALPADRAAAISQLWGPAEGCDEPFVPPLESAADLLFIDALARSLDVAAAPGATPAAGKLALEPWLERYERAVGFVTTTKMTWAYLPSLLSQRGELHGLSAAGTTTYSKVTDMALAHAEAMGKLAAQHPTRFSVVGLTVPMLQPGALKDRRLLPKVAALVDQTVKLKIAAATTDSQLFEAAGAAFVAGMSYPPALQGAQLTALRDALGAKLDGDFGGQKGWGMAGLHAGRSVLDLLLGADPRLALAATRVATALSADDIAYPALAELATVATRYTQLAASRQLDMSVSNPRMFPEDRVAARGALRSALLHLADDGAGPATPQEEELLALLVDLGDALIAAGLAEILTEDDTPACLQDEGKGPRRDALDRIQKQRRRLLDLAAFSAEDGSAWARRARVAALAVSDLLDLVDRSGDLDFAVSEARAQAIIEAALKGWAARDIAAAVSGIYLVGRAAASNDSANPLHLRRNAVRALEALAKLFEGEGAGGRFFSSLAELGNLKNSVAVATQGADIEALMRSSAEQAYEKGEVHLGDLLMLVGLTVNGFGDEPVSPEAVAIAEKYQRPVKLALLLYDRSARDSLDPAELRRALDDAMKGECEPPDPGAVMAVRQAVYDFKGGRRDTAISTLERILEDAHRDGLEVPRRRYKYSQQSGDKVFNAEQTLSLAGRMLAAPNTFQVGIGYSSLERDEASMEVSFAKPSNEANEEAARFYAHTALLTAVYNFVEKRDAAAVRAAQQAIGSYASGTRLGDVRVSSQGKTEEWLQGTRPTLILAAQLAGEAHRPFLAADLWALAKSSLNPGEDDDETVGDLLAMPLPGMLAIDDLEPVAARAAANLELLAASLPCTKKRGDAKRYLRVGCDDYGTAIAMRIAGGLEVLPRLKGRPDPGDRTCSAYAALDEFMLAADEKRYSPDAFLASVEALRRAERSHAAALLLTRHRPPSHCTPQVVSHARGMGDRQELGIHLRADLYSVAANCDNSAEVEKDMANLDNLTAELPLPNRNFEVLVFGIRLALEADRWQPLLRVAEKEDFIGRWQKLTPDLGTVALLVDHAARLGAGQEIDKQATLPYYRLLCTTFPAKERGPMCNAISLMRGGNVGSDHKRTAKDALQQVMAAAMAGASPTGGPP